MDSFTHLNILLEVILNSYFLNSRCISTFIDDSNQIKFTTEIPFVHHNADNAKLHSDINIICQDVIIQTQDPMKLFETLEKIIGKNVGVFNERRYIVIQNPDITYPLDIFQSKELNYVADFLLIKVAQTNVSNGYSKIFNETEEIYEFYTHSYRDVSYLGHKPIKLDKWFSSNSTFLHDNNLFPDKLRNQFGRKLEAGTFHYQPYSIIGNFRIVYTFQYLLKMYTSEEVNNSFDGTEMRFVREFAQKYNITLNFTIVDDMWGDIFANGTGFGLLGSLVDNVVDIGFAGLFIWDEYYKYLDYTKPLIRTGVTCLVPAPRLAAGWMMPLYSFSLHMWIALIVLFLLDIFILSLLITFKTSVRTELVKNLKLSAMVISKIFVLQPIKIPGNGKVIKYYIFINLLYVLFLSASYSSGLASIMTIPRYQNVIQSVEDLAHSGLPWGANSDAWITSLKTSHMNDYEIIKNNFEVKDDEALFNISGSSNFGFAIEHLPYRHFAIGPYITRNIIEKYRLMHDDIYWAYCTFMVRKNSVLLPLIDKLLLKTSEAGLMAYWENEIVSKYMDTFVQKVVFNSHNGMQEHEVIQLSWVHVEGAFAFLLIGYLASAVCFISEKMMTH